MTWHVSDSHAKCPGEDLFCHGCHGAKWATPATSSRQRQNATRDQRDSGAYLLADTSTPETQWGGGGRGELWRGGRERDRVVTAQRRRQGGGQETDWYQQIISPPVSFRRRQYQPAFTSTKSHFPPVPPISVNSPSREHSLSSVYILGLRSHSDCTWEPSAAEPARPASRTCAAVGDAMGDLHHPGPDCSAAAAADGGRLHTTPAGSSHCSPGAAGCWRPPAASRGRAGGARKVDDISKICYSLQCCTR